MKEIKEISNALSKGDVKGAFEIRKSISGTDTSTEYEIIEIVRQASISYLKDGSIEKAKLTFKLFNMPKDLVDETIKQAVLSSFRDKNIDMVKTIKKEVPITGVIGAEIVAFCESWGNESYTKSIHAVFA